MAAPATLEVIQDPSRAQAALHPMRQRLLGALSTPRSAAALARELGLPRQKVNYHLRELEREGLVVLHEERRRGNCVERIVRATASAYVVDPRVLERLAPTADDARDRLSSTYLVAATSRLIQDVAILQQRAARAGQTLPTLTLQADVRFRSAADRSEFAEALAEALAGLVAKYHDETARAGRPYRFLVGSHPVMTKTE